MLPQPTRPLASVRGLNPGLTLSLMSVRRTAPRLITVKLRVAAARDARKDVLDNLTGLELGQG